MQEIINSMPKVVLHLHLDGSLRPTSVQRWLQQQGIVKGIDEVREALMVDKDCRDLNQYLQKFDLPVKVLQDEETIREATYELFEDLSKQNVIYAEVRFAPSKHTEKGLTYDEVVDSAIKGMDAAKLKFGIDGSLILCCMRGDSTQQHLETINTAKKFLNRGVSAIDLAGAEALFPTKDYESIFRKAIQEGIPYTIHAGEADGPDSIRAALNFRTKRIGHGIRCIEDAELRETLRINEIILEVCPTSNLQTQAVEGKYPLEELYMKGILTTISTDNNTVSSTDILSEYNWILENTNLNYKDLIQMNINAARGVFAEEQRKAELIARIKQFRDKENNELGRN